MSDGIKKPASDALEILQSARSLPPVDAVEALQPFFETIASEPSKKQTCRCTKRNGNGISTKP